MLVTSHAGADESPDGRYYATNVFEGVLITLLGKRPEDVTVEDYEALLERMNWRPTIAEAESESSTTGLGCEGWEWARLDA